MIVHANYSPNTNYSFYNENLNSSIFKTGKYYYPQWTKGGSNIFSGVFLLIFAIVGSALNIFIIIAIVPNRRLRSVRNILLVHLAVLGLLHSAFGNLFAAIVMLCGKWIGGHVSCQIFGFLQSALTITTVWTIAGLSLDKYHTIASPLHHSLTATVKKMSVTFLAYWFSAIIFALPPLIGGNEYWFHRVQGMCSVNHFHKQGRWYFGILVLVTFYLPLFVMLYCYTHIFRIARTQSSRIAATMVRMACVVQVPIAPNSQATQIGPSSIKGTKAMLTIFQLIGAFAVTYIPYSIVIVIESIVGEAYVNDVIFSVVTSLYQAAPMTNGAVYGIRNKILRNSFNIYSRRKFQHLRYKDKRRGSIKRSSSFRMSLLQRKNNQNGDIGGLRRTQSLQPRYTNRQQKDTLKPDQDVQIRKAHSFTIGNGHRLTVPEFNIPEQSHELSMDSITPLEMVVESPVDGECHKHTGQC